MMMKKNIHLLLIFAFMSLNTTVRANDTQFKKWKCKLCPSIEGWYGNFTLGFDYSNEDNLRYISYRGIDDTGFYLSIGGALHYRKDDGVYFNLYADNIGRDNGRIELDTGKQGAYQLRLGLNTITRYRGNESRSPFITVDGNDLRLPENWVSGATTQDFSELASSLRDVPLKTQRQIFDAGITYKIDSNWQYQIDYQNQRKKGTRPFSGGLFLFNSSTFAAPVNFNTDQIDMRLSWNGKRSHVQFSAFGSWFNNSFNSITWQNPFVSDSDTQVLRSSLEPDNNFYQFSVKGAFAVSPKLRMSGQVSLGRAQQNNDFLPYSINPSFNDLVVPRSSLNGQLNTANLNLSGKLSIRPSRKLTLTARAKVNERDNKTPVELYSPVITDLFLPGDRLNRPYSYDKKQYSFDLLYKAHRNTTFSAGIKHLDFDRTLQEITRSIENTLWAEASIIPNATAHVRVKIESSDRDVSTYNQANDGGPIDHPLLRKFNQADRIRDKALVQFDYNPTDRLGLNFSYYYADDDFRRSPLGLQNSNEQSYNIDLNYAIHNKIQLNAFYNRVTIDALLTNAISINDQPWTGMTKDSIDSFGFGISSELSKNTHFGLDYIASDSTGLISVTTSINEEPFPDIITNLDNVRLYLNYQTNSHWAYSINAQYEKFSSNDFALDGIAADSLDEILLLGTQAPNYDAWLISFQARYQF